jgi:hypothetical protein
MGYLNNGNYLVFCNARFEREQCQGGSCESEMVKSLKVNDSTFSKVTNSDSIIANVNDTNFIHDAPSLNSGD